MENTLYHYVHCPFCLRVRMAAGFLKISYTSKVLRYDDESTPTNLIGKKMLPIWSDSSGTIPESLDIIQKIDTQDVLQVKKMRLGSNWGSFEQFIQRIGDTVHPLAMPYFIHSPEFDDKSREYFKSKKESKRGPFKNLVKQRIDLEKSLKQITNEIEYNLKPYYSSDKLSILDICIASHLWGMYVVPEFQFTPHIHYYLQKVKAQCQFNYHEDLWK